ncbi:glucosidase 2 subunit beta-like [Macrosteles quadrilineatus]|uniref:glucosidase 2 subunit beta-like n=1 Tax=Macrosteles quadrilineatus TaxID=74068 RepID=UPI0023E292C0|nr:glucosidase 2 subunit beta-like [Macrosteles quadrilineatus]
MINISLKIGCMLVLFNINVSSEILRPRGVSISKVSLYDPSTEFTCFDGLRTIPFKYVNDDYCDCHDGTDEPGTPACPNGVFHCTNAGHKPLNIPSSRVNDGICDCCDASDEYLTGNCSDTCYVLGEEARQQAKQRAELLRQGGELRQQLISRGKQMKQEKLSRAQSLERDKAEAEAVKKEKEILKQEAEAAESVALEAYRLVEEAEREKKQEEEKAQEQQEAFEHFQLIDSNQDGKITAAELEARQTFDQNKDGVVSEDEVKFFLGIVEEADWDHFLAEVYPRMKPFFMMEKGLFQPPSEQKEEDDAEHNSDQENPEEWGEEEEEKEEEEEQPEDEEKEHKDDAEQVDLEEDETKQKYDAATQGLIGDADKARADFESAERALRDVERELKHLQEGLEKDYGPEDDFSALDGECFEYSDREYTYKLCPFDQVSQKPRSGGAETRLGSWSGWAGAGDKYSAMMYDQGQSCWNGPQRSTYVDVICGLESAVTTASEPNRCEYRLTFTTPAACRAEQPLEPIPHDEL